MTQQEINGQSMLRVGTILRGIYRIDSYLSSGGFGNTYVATNIEFDERVAIKEFFMKGVTQREDNQTTVSVSNTDNKDSFQAQREKFKKEARRIRQLRNPHIVNVHDLFEENGTAYYVMDYVDGENLSERLKRTGKPMTEQEVRDILPQILDALKSVHDAGIWHLDLKPANIMLEKSGNIKLIDFGASKQMDSQKGGATTSTAISYTNGYAPREQMEQNYDKFGPWTDIYALGATLYNLLTNKRPPLPSDIDDDETEDKHEALPFTSHTSASMKKLVIEMMETNRTKRPKSIGSIVCPDNGNEEMQGNLSDENTILNTGEKKQDEETIIVTSPNTNTGTQQDSENIESDIVNMDDAEVISEGSAKEFWNDYKWYVLIILCVGLLVTYYFSCSGNQVVNVEPSDNNIEAVDSIDEEGTGKIYDVVEEMPQFPGGTDALVTFLQNNIVYPPEAEEKGIEGKVVVSFIIEPDGSINTINVVTPVDQLLDTEAVRVILSMPKWIPGKQNGVAVRVKYTVPITFRLE